MQERFTVAQPSAAEDKQHLDWGRLLSVYGAVALGKGPLSRRHRPHHVGRCRLLAFHRPNQRGSSR